MTESEGTITDLSPSAKLVYKTLEYDGPMTHAQLAEETLLPQRTVRYAIKQLAAIDIITESVYLIDARKSTYALRIPDDEKQDTLTA